MCLHCGIATTSAEGDFCCAGCRAVHALLTTKHLDRYYDLRGERGVPVPERRFERRDLKWLGPMEERLRSDARVDLDLQGLHCSACIWLIETIFRRMPGGLRITVNPTIGRVHILASHTFDLRAFVVEVEELGYLFGPPLKVAALRSRELVWRMGICIALAMNAMIFAIAIYAGLRDGPTYVLFERANLGLSCVSVLVGGPVFFRSAWQGLKKGVLHLDLPIALGILLAFGGSLFAYATHRDRGVFVDTLDVFIALMLVGRWLQERALERNRMALLADDGAEGLLARRVEAKGIVTVRCTELRAGDRLIIAPGDLVPLASMLCGGDSASFSLDWINGESRARSYAEAEIVPAGAFLTGARAVTVVARTDFAESTLLDLLRAPLPREADAAMSMPWWQLLAKWYVAAVLVAAGFGFISWYAWTKDLGRALEVTTAVLIVTCPCAFGIAMPLAYDLAQTGLRRAGLYVRSAGFLDRAAHVKTVVFDKTGTLTDGTLRCPDTRFFETLSAAQRHALFTMVAASNHPKSAAIRRISPGEATVTEAHVEELAGLGLTLVVGGEEYRLGAPAWVASARGNGDVSFGRDGVLLASIATEESLRADARSEVEALRQTGFEVWLLSGDESARAVQTARLAGIAEGQAIGDASAEGKAKWVDAHDHRDLLMIGDGLNDSLVVARAFCSGTPAIDRPFMAARSDFYFVTPGLGPIRLALRAAAKLARVRRRTLTIAVAYNVLSTSLAYAGVMSPLLCAVLMPASSLVTILFTTVSLSSRSALWRS